VTAALTRPGLRGNPPGRHGPNSWTQYATMPWQFTEALQQLTGDRLNTALFWAAQAGWTPTLLANVLDVSRQHVSRRISIASYHPAASPIPIPEPE
jgi:hypothetical protein